MSVVTKRILKLILCLLAIIMAGFSAKLYCQDYTLRVYGVSDGLPQSELTFIFQDSRGYFWIATRNGLSRFDGIESVNYYKKDGLPSNSIIRVFEDYQKKIWILTREGPARFNGKSFDFFAMPAEVDFPIGSMAIKDSLIYLLGTTWDIKRSSLFILKDGVFTKYSSLFPQFDTLVISSLGSDNENGDMLFLDNHHNLWKWDFQTLSKVTSKRVDGLVTERDGIRIYLNDTIFSYSGGKLILSELKKEYGNPDVSLYTLPGLRTTNISFFNGKETISFQSKIPYSLTMIDDNGVLWLKAESSLHRLVSTAFSSFNQQEKIAPGLWAIAEDRNGHIWLGSIYGKLVEYDGKRFIERTEQYRLFKPGLAFYKGSRTMQNGDIWFSTNMGILIWDGNKFSRLGSIPDNTQVCYIYQDTLKGQEMIGTDKGLYIHNKGSMWFYPEFTDSDLGVIEGITADDSGGYWLSGHRGILRFNGERAVPVVDEILPDEFTFTLVNDSRGGLWITSDEGLWYRNPLTSRFEHGLPEPLNKPANSILEIDSNRIIVGRSTDICVIDLSKFYNDRKEYFRFYDLSDGYPGDDCLDNGIIRDRNGIIWILTSERIVRFDPEGLSINNKPPVIHFSGLQFQTDSLEWQPANSADFFYGKPGEIELNRRQNKVQITFTGISTTNPEKVKYTYRLSGIDKKWSLPSEKRSVVYENLPPGSYLFELNAINADGIATQTPETLQFQINPAFWQRRLFILMAIMLSLISTSIITRAILKRKQLQDEEEQKLKTELSRLQLDSVLRQFDPHFTFNLISSVGSLIMKNEKEIAYNYITKLSTLLRSAISDDKIVVRPLSEEIGFVTVYCELQKLRFGDRLDYIISVSDDVDSTRLIPRMTIQPFVENAIKHGIENSREGGRLRIDISKNVNNLEIVIRDNGIGRKSAEMLQLSGTGTGLKTISRLFDYFNVFNDFKCSYKISDYYENNAESGTEVRIIIPDKCNLNLPGQTDQRKKR